MFLLNLTLTKHSWDSKPFGVGHSNIWPNYLMQSVNKIKPLCAACRTQDRVAWRTQRTVVSALTLENVLPRAVLGVESTLIVHLYRKPDFLSNKTGRDPSKS